MMDCTKDITPRAQNNPLKVTTADLSHTKCRRQESRSSMPTIVILPCMLAAVMVMLCLMGSVSAPKILALSIGMCFDNVCM
jgi:hypothetical protein